MLAGCSALTSGDKAITLKACCDIITGCGIDAGCISGNAHYLSVYAGYVATRLGWRSLFHLARSLAYIGYISFVFANNTIGKGDIRSIFIKQISKSPDYILVAEAFFQNLVYFYVSSIFQSPIVRFWLS